MQGWLIKLLVQAEKNGQAVVSLPLPGTGREHKLEFIKCLYCARNFTNVISIQSLRPFFEINIFIHIS